MRDDLLVGARQHARVTDDLARERAVAHVGAADQRQRGVHLGSPSGRSTPSSSPASIARQLGVRVRVDDLQRDLASLLAQDLHDLGEPLGRQPDVLEADDGDVQRRELPGDLRRPRHRGVVVGEHEDEARHMVLRACAANAHARS